MHLFFSASTNFTWVSSFPGGVLVTDYVIFGDPIYQPNTKIRVLNDGCNPDDVFISLRPNRGGNDFTFIGDFIIKQDEPVVTINFEQIGANGSLNTNGTLSVAGRMTDLCQDDWTYIPSKPIDNHDSWSVEVEQ